MLNLCRRIMPPVALALLLISGFALRVGADTVNMELTGVNGVATDSIYVDPYSGTINGASAVLYCDDFTHDSSVGLTWTADVTSYTQLALEDGSATNPWTVRFTTLPSNTYTENTVLQNYEAAGWLVQQMAATTIGQKWSDYSFALWAIFNYAQVSTYDGFDSAAQGYYAAALTFALTNPSLSDFAGLEIYTPANGQPSQEFITDPVAEPSSLVLVGLGLLMIVAVIRLRITGPGLHPVG